MTRERADAVRRWLPAVLWAVVISGFSTSWFTSEETSRYVLPILAILFPHARPEDLLTMHFWIRKLAHFTEYLVLSTLLYRGVRGTQRWSVRAAVVAVVIAGAYSVGDELHQWFVPGRTAAATDCLIDVSGAAAGQGLLAAWARVLRT